ncbi:hypothetical protein BC829DRAFT_434408 [Chytridium lagenaria]|nr:hypothetical protein BC829DRAFT_434408 [Chytridium lagenaria]
MNFHHLLLLLSTLPSSTPASSTKAKPSASAPASPKPSAPDPVKRGDATLGFGGQEIGTLLVANPSPRNNCASSPSPETPDRAAMILWRKREFNPFGGESDSVCLEKGCRGKCVEGIVQMVDPRTRNPNNKDAREQGSLQSGRTDLELAKSFHGGTRCFKRFTAIQRFDPAAAAAVAPATPPVARCGCSSTRSTPPPLRQYHHTKHLADATPNSLKSKIPYSSHCSSAVIIQNPYSCIFLYFSKSHVPM